MYFIDDLKNNNNKKKKTKPHAIYCVILTYFDHNQFTQSLLNYHNKTRREKDRKRTGDECDTVRFMDVYS